MAANLLLETGDVLLQETGDAVLLDGYIKYEASAQSLTASEYKN